MEQEETHFITKQSNELYIYSCIIYIRNMKNDKFRFLCNLRSPQNLVSWASVNNAIHIIHRKQYLFCLSPDPFLGVKKINWCISPHKIRLPSRDTTWLVLPLNKIS